MSPLVGPKSYNMYVPTGRQGQAITLVTQYDIHLLHAVEEQISKWVGSVGGLPAWATLELYTVQSALLMVPSQHYNNAC